MKSQLFDKLSTATHLLLNCENDFFEMKKAIDLMYEIYTSISDIRADDFTQEEIILPTGKAISPGAAAHCLLELQRTAVFLRGIFKAIQDAADKNKKRPITILYAGCGPYATLLTPLLTILPPEQLQVDLLDINEITLESAKKIIAELELGDSVGNFILTDAATYTIPAGTKYDILLSETMQACLDHEPQVAILKNLVPQLSDDAIVIPEAVEIDARLVDPRQEQKHLFYSQTPKPDPERIALGKVLILHKGRLSGGDHDGEVTVPDKIGTCVELKLFTTVRVFGDLQLIENNSSITMAKKYYDFSHHQYARKIRFRYDQTGGPLPKMDCRVIEDNDTAAIFNLEA